MVLDMSGFSRTTQDRGITPFLLMIHQMRLLTLPSVADHRGKVVKSEADNLYCIFDSVDDAVAASREIAVRLQTANLILPKDRKLYASIGIGYGSVLNIGDQDLWGAEMNLACKLGEDIAELGDILLSEAAMAALSAGDLPVEQHSVSVSGLELNYYQLT
jgi:class 3 adenylate cyclase